MKKIICSVLLFVMGFACINLNAVLNFSNAENNYCEETQYIEVQKSKPKKRAQNTVIENETNFIDYETVYFSDESSTVVVTFDCNYGTYDGLTTFQQTVNAGTFLTKPDETKLSRVNCKFLGWYTPDGKKWDFNKDKVSEDIVLQARWEWDNSIIIENLGSISNYFTKKYPSSLNWHRVKYTYLSDAPVEVKDSDFPKSDIDTAISRSGIESSYGGCGPLAMIGIMDYFARYRDYSSIMNDPTSSDDRIALAYQVFKNTKTHQGLFSINRNVISNNALTVLSGGDKSTITYPDDYVEGFNKLMKEYYHLDKQISASYTGLISTKETKIKRAIQAIDYGFPATIYVSLGGDGTFANHYVNIYEYEIWEGTDLNGNILRKTIFNTRVNWGWTGYRYRCHMDADLLSTITSGVIYYNVKDSNQLIRPSDFSKDFVNESGQGQYYFYDKTADITTANGFKFGTKRLRCGYIEDKYLVLSANRQGAGLAYLEMNFDINVKAFNFDISRWSSKEGVISHIKLYYKDENGNWQELHDFSPVSVTTAKDYMDNYYMTFPVATNGIKFEVYSITANSETNKGRVVLGDMNLFY